eukprot:scaffold4686_cov140-Amphora_coffeaeformis.AAC.2
MFQSVPLVLYSLDPASHSTHFFCKYKYKIIQYVLFLTFHSNTFLSDISSSTEKKPSINVPTHTTHTTYSFNNDNSIVAWM